MARPKKNVTENEEVKVTPVVEEKKAVKRGRPPKNASASAVSEAPAEETSAALPVSEEKAEEVKVPAKRGRKKKTETAQAASAPAKEPAKRGRKKKTESALNLAREVKMVLQYGKDQIEEKDMIEKAEKAWRAEGNKGNIDTFELYVKPEEGKIYYVVNGFAGSVSLF